MNTSKKNISPTEWRVMKIIWSQGSAVARDIYQVAEERYGMTKGTTKLMLSRLVEKGHLETQPIGNCYLYKPVGTILDSVSEAADDLLEHTSEEVADSLTLQLVKRGKLSEEGIRKLKALLDEYQE